QDHAPGGLAHPLTGGRNARSRSLGDRACLRAPLRRGLSRPGPAGAGLHLPGADGPAGAILRCEELSALPLALLAAWIRDQSGTHPPAGSSFAIARGCILEQRRLRPRLPAPVAPISLRASAGVGSLSGRDVSTLKRS